MKSESRLGIILVSVSLNLLDIDVIINGILA